VRRRLRAAFDQDRYQTLKAKGLSQRASQKTKGQPDLCDELQSLLAWWRTRQGEIQQPPAKLERVTYHLGPRWREAVRREADHTGDSYAAVVNRALKHYFEGKATQDYLGVPLRELVEAFPVYSTSHTPGKPTALAAYPLEGTRSTSVHTGVNKIVPQFVTILLSYQKFTSTYEARDVEVVSFLLTQEGMKNKMSRLPRKMRY
jgi:hypothetical protein